MLLLTNQNVASQHVGNLFIDQNLTKIVKECYVEEQAISLPQILHNPLQSSMCLHLTMNLQKVILFYKHFEDTFLYLEDKRENLFTVNFLFAHLG